MTVQIDAKKAKSIIVKSEAVTKEKPSKSKTQYRYDKANWIWTNLTSEYTWCRIFIAMYCNGDLTLNQFLSAIVEEGGELVNSNDLNYTSYREHALKN